MLYGESGSFKSFLALDMALCLAFGIPGQWGAPPVKNDVLFFAGEGPVATAKKRWPAWMEWQSIEFRNDHRFFISSEVPLYTDTAAWENVKLDLAELKAKPSLIIIDTMTRLITGLDENSAKDASMVTKFMEQLARYYECFVLAIHHTGKDQNKGARGSSAFYANMDTVISTKLKQGGTELRVKKQKDADVSEESSNFAVKEIGASIVLERTAELADLNPKKQTSRYGWASVEEVTKDTLKGSTVKRAKGF
jgi:putative DNA primase/helicase